MASPDQTGDEHPFARFLVHPHLGRRLGLLAVLLCSTGLGLGFHLDDHMHRYMLSDLPGGPALRAAYESPFGIANGQPASIRWQIEHGYAPWWTDEHLLVSLWRPLSEALHELDVWLWFDSAPLMHLHSLLWWFLLVVASTALYRAVHGVTTVAGLAALFYAIDHTHGFAVGWIANRNAVVAALASVCCLWSFVRAYPAVGASTDRACMRDAVLAWLSFVAGLLCGEGSVAIAGYLVAHASCVQSGPRVRRALRVLPYAVTVVVWRVVYQAIGRGAHGSGLYLDPVREPLRFAQGVLERGPVLLLGQLALPPAEAYVFFPFQAAHLAVAVCVGLAFGVALFPLLRRDRTARFWALGMLASLVPACATHPNNRLLFFAGLGAMGLLSQLWHGYVSDADWLPTGPFRGAGRTLTAALAGFHLVVSPVLLPITTLGVAVTARLQDAVEGVLQMPGLAGETLVVVDAPDYFATKLLQPLAALRGLGAPQRVHVLSYGAVPLRVTRVDERAVVVDYGGGLLQRPTDWLYSHPDKRIEVGFTRALAGMHLRVLEVTPDGRPSRVRFDFDAPLDAPDSHWVRWEEDHFEPLSWAQEGSGFSQPAAHLPLPFASLRDAERP